MPKMRININKLLKNKLRTARLAMTNDDCCQNIISGCNCSQIIATCPTFWQQVCAGLKSCLQPNSLCVDFTPNPDLCGDFTPNSLCVDFTSN
jgi:hypothetical protein